MLSFRPMLPAEKGKGRPPKQIKGRAETLEIVSQPVPTQPHFLVTKAVSLTWGRQRHTWLPLIPHTQIQIQSKGRAETDSKGDPVWRDLHRGLSGNISFGSRSPVLRNP